MTQRRISVTREYEVTDEAISKAAQAIYNEGLAQSQTQAKGAIRLFLRLLEEDPR